MSVCLFLVNRTNKVLNLVPNCPFLQNRTCGVTGHVKRRDVQGVGARRVVG